MRRKMVTILTGMMSLTALTMAIPTQAAEVNSSGYLDTYDKLQEYAWSLQYPEQGPFDIWLVSNEQGGARFVSNVPQTVFGYQIRDFDSDRQVELLIVGTKTESDKLYMQMYEVTNGVVTLQSEIETDGVALFPEEGISRCYSYLNDQNERLIGYDLWYYLSYIADGTNVSTELFQYDGMTLSKVDSYGISGSSGFEDADIVGNYAKRGIYNVDDVALLNGATTACQYLATSEVFVELKNKLLSYDADAYMEWTNTGRVNPYLLGSTYVRNCCWLPEGTAERIWGAQQLPQQTVLRAQQLEQKQTQLSAIFDAADYMYVSYGYGDQGISEIFYLVPNVEKTIYQCYDAEGNLSYTIPYANAKSIVDQAMGEGQGLPCTGERCMIIWDSPYGLCAYDRYCRDYNSTYTADNNGEVVEVPVDMSILKYTLDEAVVANMANSLNITVPHSDREQ